MTAASHAYRDQIYRALLRACELPGVTVDTTTRTHLRKAADAMTDVLTATHTEWRWHRYLTWNGWALYRDEVLLGYVQRVPTRDGADIVNYWHPHNGEGRPLTSTPLPRMEQAREAVQTVARVPVEAIAYDTHGKGQASVTYA